MREILFRAKRSDNRQWVQGSLLFYPDWNRAFMSLGKFKEGSFIEVQKDTIGQYTGLTDKNGKKIFEGDIVRTDKFSEPNKQYIIKYDLQFGAFIGQDRYNCYFVTFDGDSDEFEVIGNIHDNPELLKAGEAV